MRITQNRLEKMTLVRTASREISPKRSEMWLRLWLPWNTSGWEMVSFFVFLNDVLNLLRRRFGHGATLPGDRQYHAAAAAKRCPGHNSAQFMTHRPTQFLAPRPSMGSAASSLKRMRFAVGKEDRIIAEMGVKIV